MKVEIGILETQLSSCLLEFCNFQSFWLNLSGVLAEVFRQNKRAGI
jgi:hypothetical protein